MKKVYILPNLVTTANLFCGFYSILAAVQGRYATAALAIVAATVFDLLDGRVARWARATSQFGVEYDSLCDLVSFGVAPALLLYQWALRPYERLGVLAAFLFMACGALRLARFNVTSGKVPKGYFQGVPIPIAAGLVATYVIFQRATGWPGVDAPIARESFVLGLTFTMASLMVSTILFPSFKELKWRSRASFGYLMVGVLSMILVAVKPEVTLFLVLATYVVGGLVWNLSRVLRGVPKPVVTSSDANA